VRYRNETLPASRQEVLQNARDADAILCYLVDKIDAEFMEACPSLKVVANIAVGYDNVDIKEATLRGILVTNTPGVLTDATADLTFALLLAGGRRIVEADRYVREGKWVSWTVDLMIGHELSGKTLGIVGMGRIGRAVAQRAHGFDMNIVYTRRADKDELDAELEERFNANRVNFEELLQQSDFISLHCPLNDSTRHLIGAQQFELMQPGAVLINTARGAVIDEKALIEALKERKIAAAALDVFEWEPQVSKELIEMPNVVLVPHIGSATFETRAAMVNSAASALLNAFSRTMPKNAVNAEAWEQNILVRR
jgi:glyoxylate reductase